MSLGDVARQTPRALLAPFQGAGRFGVVGRADPVVSPLANFWRASGTGTEFAIVIFHPI
jgi:hypothetical protein